MSGFDNKTRFDWSSTVYYGNPTEELPTNAPEPLGKRVTLIDYFDANLMHDVLSGKAVSGCLHMWRTRLLWCGIPRNKLRLKPLLMVPNLYQDEHVFNKSLTFVIPSDILESHSMILATYLVITRPWSTARHSCVPNYIRDTTSCLTIMFKAWSLPDSLLCTIFLHHAI